MTQEIDSNQLLSATLASLTNQAVDACTSDPIACARIDDIVSVIRRYAAYRGLSTLQEKITVFEPSTDSLWQESREFESLSPYGVAFLDAYAAQVARLENQICHDHMSKSVDTEAPITEALLSAYLRARFPQDEDILARNLSVPPGGGGFGKETLFFDIVRHGKSDLAVAMRRDRPVLYTGTSVAYEYPLLVALANRGFSVPIPLWLEETTPLIPRPFLLTERLMARPTGNYAAVSADFSGDPVVMLAKFAAELHRIPVTDLKVTGYSDCVFDSNALLRTHDYWKSTYDEAKGFREPVLDICFGWLQRNAGWGITSGVIVHGDFGFHNILMSDDGVGTLLDWEGAHLGSAAEDIAAVRETLQSTSAFERFLTFYTSLGGILPTPAALAYYDVFRLVRRAVICRGVVVTFNKGQHTDLRGVALCARIYAENIQALCAKLRNYGVAAPA